MAGNDSSESPVEAAAGPHVTDTFSLLGNETRLAILLELWEAYEPHTERNAVSFSELRERVGVRDSGQFNYHLGKLDGQYIQKTADGYGLRRTGRMLVQSIIAGTGIEEPSLEPTEIDAQCEICGAPTAITYENVYVYRVCTNCPGETGPGDEHPTGALAAWTFEPTGLSNRTAREVFTASTIKNFGRIAMRFEGICPSCSGPVTWSLDICEDHVPGSNEGCSTCGRKRAIQARETCSVCKSAGFGSPGIKVLFHPAVIAFYYDRGIEVGFTGNTGFTDVIRTLALGEDAKEELVSADPPRIRVTFAHDSDEISLTLDEELTVLDVRERTVPADVNPGPS